ncbi:MAG: hypothetical protein AB8B57_10220 [Congregibacter sp.]
MRRELLFTVSILLLTSLPAPLLAQEISGASKAVQARARIVQARGQDAQVDYRALTRFGPWDDRNYSVTSADLALLPPNDQYLADVPAFFKVFLRKEQPGLGDYYPRSAAQYFRILHGGLTVNNRLFREGLGIGYHPEPTDVVASRESSKAAENEAGLQLSVAGNEVAIECNPTNSLECVAGSNTMNGQTMYWSADGGATWNFSQTNALSCCDPTIDWSSDGARVYQADLSSTLGVRWAVSTDSGRTWGPMRSLTTSGSDKEFLHVDRSPDSPNRDNIYLTYHNANTMQFARSTNQGRTFQTPISFPGEPRGIGSDITTDAAGNIYYFYPAIGGEGIRLLRSTDGGATFGPSTRVAALNGRFDFPIPAMETREAFIYVSADVNKTTGDIFVAWTDEANDSAGGGTGSAANNHAWIQVAKSTNQGATWTILRHPHNANDSLSATPIDRFHPWIKVGEDGVVHIAYYDTRHSTNRTGVDFYYTRSTNGGMSWEPEQRFSTETSPNLPDGQEWGDYNALSVVLDSVVLGWTDNRASNNPPGSSDKVAMAGRDDRVATPVDAFSTGANGVRGFHFEFGDQHRFYLESVYPTTVNGRLTYAWDNVRDPGPSRFIRRLNVMNQSSLPINFRLKVSPLSLGNIQHSVELDTTDSVAANRKHGFHFERQDRHEFYLVSVYPTTINGRVGYEWDNVRDPGGSAFIRRLNVINKSNFPVDFKLKVVKVLDPPAPGSVVLPTFNAGLVATPALEETSSVAANGKHGFHFERRDRHQFYLVSVYPTTVNGRVTYEWDNVRDPGSSSFIRRLNVINLSDFPVTFKIKVVGVVPRAPLVNQLP